MDQNDKKIMTTTVAAVEKTSIILAGFTAIASEIIAHKTSSVRAVIPMSLAIVAKNVARIMSIAEAAVVANVTTRQSVPSAIATLRQL